MVNRPTKLLTYDAMLTSSHPFPNPKKNRNKKGYLMIRKLTQTKHNKQISIKYVRKWIDGAATLTRITG